MRLHLSIVQARLCYLYDLIRMVQAGLHYWPIDRSAALALSQFMLFQRTRQRTPAPTPMPTPPQQHVHILNLDAQLKAAQH